MTDKLRQVLNNEGQKIVEAGGNSFIFVHGYKTFLNNLWHDTSEKPFKDKILIHYGIDNFIVVRAAQFDDIIWEKVIKWCYLDDILPDNNNMNKIINKTSEKCYKCEHYTFGSRALDCYCLLPCENESQFIDRTK